MVNINIGGRLHSTATGNVVTGADEVLYEPTGGTPKKQSDVNQETDAALADRYTKSETYSKTQLNSMITTPNQEYVTLVAESGDTISDIFDGITGAADTTYRVGNWDGSANSGAGGYDITTYSEYAYNGTNFVHLSTKTQIGEVFDISAYHATGGTLATYTDLADALTGTNGGVPQSLQKGGMSVKYVQSSDNKYVKFFCTADEFTTDVTQWQKQGAEVTVSQNTLAIGGEERAKVLTDFEFATFQKSYKSLSLVFTQGKIINYNNGSFADTTKANEATEDFYPVNGNTYLIAKIYLRSGWSAGIAFYDSDYNYISGYSSQTAGTLIHQIPIPEKAYYVRFSNDYNNCQSPMAYLISDGNEFRHVEELKTRVNNLDYQKGYIENWAEVKSYIGRMFALYYSYTANYYYKVIPVNPNDIVKITANSVNNLDFYILKSFTERKETTNMTPDFATGETGRRRISSGHSDTFTTPSDASYLMVQSIINNTDATPDEFTINGYDVLKGRYAIKDNTKGIRNINTRLGKTISFQQGIVSRTTGAVDSTQSTYVCTSLIPGPFKLGLKMTSPSLSIYSVCEYDIDGNFIREIAYYPGMGYSTEGTNLYRVCIRKEEMAPISPTEELIDSIVFGIDYTLYENAEFTKRFEDARVESLAIPYSRGTDGNVATTSGHRYDRLNLIFMTDTHIDIGANAWASYNNVIDAVSFANHLHLPLSVILQGGDIVTHVFGTKQAHIDNMQRFFEQAWKSNVPLLFTKGNHDTNTINVPVANVLTDDDWNSIWFDDAETNYGIVRKTKANGKKSGYYYYDLDSYKVRIIVVDCNDCDMATENGNGQLLYQGGMAFYISNEQMNWIAETALDFDDKDDKGWGVLLMTHYYAPSEINGTKTTPIYASIYPKLNNMLAAFNTQSTYSETYTFADNPFFNLSINADWTRYANLTSKPYLICVLSGHRHIDSNEEYSGVQNIITACQSCLEKNLGDERVRREPYSNTQNLFDVISIDLKQRKIRCIRYGAGLNCYGTGGNRFLPEGLSF